VPARRHRAASSPSSSRRSDEVGGGPSGRATPASRRFRRRFHGASGWHSAEATWWLPRRLTLRLFCIALRAVRSNSRPRVRLSRDNGTHYPPPPPPSPRPGPRPEREMEIRGFILPPSPLLPLERKTQDPHVGLSRIRCSRARSRGDPISMAFKSRRARN